MRGSMKINMNQVNSNQLLVGRYNINGNQAKKDVNKGNNTTVFAGNSNLIQNQIDDRRKNGRNQASRIIKDVFKHDLKTDDQIKAMREEIKTLEKRAVELAGKIKKVDKFQNDLKEIYGVKESDQEFQDLLLLNKDRISSKYDFNMMSDEEKAKVAQLKNQGLTDFQKDSLINQEAREVYLTEYVEAIEGAETNRKQITGIKLGKLKSAPMVDAKRMAETILDMSEKSIKGLLINDAVEGLKEEAKEREEKVEKAKEAKNEKEAQQQKIINDNGELVEMKNEAFLVDEIQSPIKKMAKELNISLEDLKGLIVDHEL